MPAADASQHAAAFASSPAGRISTINPHTGLSTDYLNHFTEALMVLEMGVMMSDCLDDLRSWAPKSYREHFAASRFTGRDAVLAAYGAADPAVRRALDEVAADLNTALAAVRDRVLADADAAAGCAKSLTAKSPTAIRSLTAITSLAAIKPLIAHAAAIINGADAGGSQASVDAAMSR